MEKAKTTNATVALTKMHLGYWFIKFDLVKTDIEYVKKTKELIFKLVFIFTKKFIFDTLNNLNTSF